MFFFNFQILRNQGHLGNMELLCCRSVVIRSFSKQIWNRYKLRFIPVCANTFQNCNHANMHKVILRADSSFFFRIQYRLSSLCIIKKQLDIQLQTSYHRLLSGRISVFRLPYYTDDDFKNYFQIILKLKKRVKLGWEKNG